MTNFIFGNNNPVSGFKNKIINGDFRIWQRGTVFNPFATGYTTDRFIVFGGATENFITKEAFTPGQTEVPGNPEFYLKFNFSPVAQNRVLAHRIEDVHVLAGKTVTLSLWSKSMTNLTASLEFNQIFGSGGSPQVNIPTQSISLTPSWQRFSFTTTLPSVSGKTIGPNNYLNATVVRKLGGSNNSISIANVQIEEGSLATGFEQRPLSVELGLAQRYYQAINNINDFITTMHLQSTTLAYGGINLKREMRVAPSVVFTNPFNAEWNVGGGTVVLSLRSSNSKSINFTGVPSSALVAGHSLELFSGSLGTIACNAEL